VSRKIIRHGTVVTATESFSADVLVEDERIAELGSLDHLDGETIDAEGCLVLPGCIDSHTHLAEPVADGFTCDDFDTGTQAAAAGGTTCIVDFVIQQQAGGLRSSFDDWMGRAEPNAHVDYGFHVAVAYWDEATRRDVRRMIEEGVSSFKAFMAPAGVPRMNDGALLALLRETKEHGGLAMVHAENGDVIDYLVAQAKMAGRTSPATHAETRPEWTEAEAIGRAIWLAGSLDASLFVVHASCTKAVDEVREAQSRGLSVRAETCTHYLTLAMTDLQRPAEEAVRYVCSPPLRDAANQDGLWSALRDGSLTSVSSDHCPFNDVQKRVGLRDFSLVPSGLAGIQHRLPLLWHYGVRSGRISPHRLVEITSTSVARTFGLWPRKGRIAAGADADIIVFDPECRYEPSGETSFMSVDYDLWEGQTLKGCPRVTLSRGEVVFAGGAIRSKPGRGRFVRRTPLDWSA